MSTFEGPRLIPTVPGGSSRPNRTSSVKKSKFSKLLLKPFCQITAELSFCILHVGVIATANLIVYKSTEYVRHESSKSHISAYFAVVNLVLA